MANELGEKRKTLTLSLRLDPKTRFALEFVCRIKGQSITTFVERAVREVANDVCLEATESREQRNWRDFWSTSEGARTVKLLFDTRYPATYEEEELRQFVLSHLEFFFTDTSARIPQEPQYRYIEVLWPSIGEFQSIWRERRSTDLWAAGRAMAEALRAANVEPPRWRGDLHSRKPARRSPRK